MKERKFTGYIFLLIFTFTFTFALMQKKSNKRKNQGCTFLPTTVLFSAKQKELASLKQLFVFNAPKSTSASRQKSEANPPRNIVSLVLEKYNYTHHFLKTSTYMNTQKKRKHPPQLHKHIHQKENTPLNERSNVESGKSGL